jgi:hypothetical protein
MRSNRYSFARRSKAFSDFGIKEGYLILHFHYGANELDEHPDFIPFSDAVHCIAFAICVSCRQHVTAANVIRSYQKRPDWYGYTLAGDFSGSRYGIRRMEAKTLPRVKISQTWLEANAKTSGGAERMARVFQNLWGAQPRDVSALFSAFYIAAAGNETTPGSLNRLLDVRDGAEERRFVGGSQLLAQRIAASLGQQVMLSAPVRSIECLNSGVRVTADAVVAEARQVIFAIPPALAGATSYEPKLPALRAQLLQHLPSGSYFEMSGHL